MSAGHGHPRHNLRHPKELKELTDEPTYHELWQRWQKLDVDHDIPDLAGYDVAGTIRFIDRDAFHAILDPEYAEHIGVGPVDTGLSPDHTVQAIADHEGIEKTLLDADNPIDTYESAHEFATVGEHELVRSFGGSPLKYERGLQKLIKFCAKKRLVKVPHNLSCAPYLDDPDENDRRVLKVFRQFGVVDAFKLSKESVDYSLSTGADQCVGCSNWMGHPVHDLSLCRLVAGLVRKDRWCSKYERGTNASIRTPDESAIRGASEQAEASEPPQ